MPFSSSSFCWRLQFDTKQLSVKSTAGYPVPNSRLISSVSESRVYDYEDARVQRAVAHLLNAFAGLFKAITCYVLYYIFRTAAADLGKLVDHKSPSQVALEKRNSRGQSASESHAYENLMHMEQMRQIEARDRRRRSGSDIDQQRVQATSDHRRKEAEASNGINLLMSYDALVRAEMPNLVHAVATLIKCIAFYITMRALKVLVVDVLRVDLGPAAEAFIGELRNHAKPPSFHTQGGNWSSEEAGQEKRGI
ncbi:hypothetical protein E4T42_03078 [Aureobasidium subglaciale]|nr:hypothetical protein E4T42_03078 [Aureobasidium subglaciale]